MRCVRLLVLAVLSTPVLAAPPAEPVDFNRDVRPILSDVCFQCHGPDARERKGDLRIDARESLFEDRGGYHVVVPGEPGKSEIVTRLTSDDPDVKMPPPGFAKQLTPAQVDVIRRWIAEGAEWKGHWAYVPPRKPTVPADERAGFTRNAIDHFVLRMQTRKGLAPAPEADRVTLIRRLSFDLRGVPPTSKEVFGFLGDDSEDAYETLVDQFLADAKFGERMAMKWLDLVRYADTCGYHGDNDREVWLYRDWVIRAFNENKPFDAFTIEQLAGDLLPEATRSQRIASGYNALLQTTREGGAQAKEYTAKYSADRVRNASSVWLGSTMACCECHDHKFDPFAAKDFYSFAAFFADVQEVPVGAPPATRMPSDEQVEELAELAARRAELASKLAVPAETLAAELATWETTAGVTNWATAKPARATSAGGATLTIGEDGAIVASGTNPASDTYTLEFEDVPEGVTGFRLEVLPHDSFPAKGPGRAANGNFVVNEVGVTAGGQPLKLAAATANHSQKDWLVGEAIDGNPGKDNGWAILPRAGQPSEAWFEFAEDVAIPSGGPLAVALTMNLGTSHTLGHFRMSLTTSPRPVRFGGQPENVRAILALPATERTDAQRAALVEWFRGIAPSLAAVRNEIAAVDARKQAVEAAAPTTLITTAVAPREVRLLPRGNWLDDSGPVVDPALPEFLGALEVDGRATRLDLARWIASAENPLTARVVVNRLWAVAFGRGIVTTLEDFGSQGAWPTHPELLDWLAVDFVEHGWDVKRSLKQMVMSGTYRQSSVSKEALRSVDPYNKWLARQGRWRLDAEMVRDNALAISGLLNETIGGPSVRPYQPAGYLKHLNFPARTWKHDANENQYRRGLYTFWQRTFLHPSLLAFDAPSREECTVERPRSNNPLQSLVLLNDPTYVETSRAFAATVLAKGGATTQSRLAYAYRRALSRGLSGEELEILTQLLEKHQREYAADPAKADELLGTGMAPVPNTMNRAELAAWTSVARVLLNLHETITRN